MAAAISVYFGDDMTDDLIRRHREFLKDTLRKKYEFRQTGQHRGIPAPPVQKP